MILLDKNYAAFLNKKIQAAASTNTSCNINIYSDATDINSISVASPPANGKLITYTGLGLSLSSGGFMYIGVMSTTAQTAKAIATGTAKYFHLYTVSGEWVVGEIGPTHAMQLTNGNSITTGKQKKIQSFAFKIAG